jgi:NADH dehydrogenase FAD-containing subunit
MAKRRNLPGRVRRREQTLKDQLAECSRQLAAAKQTAKHAVAAANSAGRMFYGKRVVVFDLTEERGIMYACTEYRATAQVLRWGPSGLELDGPAVHLMQRVSDMEMQRSPDERLQHIVRWMGRDIGGVVMERIGTPRKAELPW